MVLQRGKVSRPVLVILIIFGILIVLPVLVFFIGIGPIDIAPASRDLDSAVVAYRAAGLPWEAKDLAPNPPVPDYDNAAPLINKASTYFQDKIWQKDEDKITKALIAGDYALAEKTLAPYNPALDLVAQATKLKGLDFHYDWDMGAFVLFPQFAYLKSLTKCLSYRARVEASKGDFKGTDRDLQEGLKLADLTGQTPTLISMLVKIAQQAIVFRAYAQCADELKGNAEALDTMEKSLASYQGGADFLFAIRGEQYMGIALLRNIDQYGGLLALKRSLEGSPDGDSPPQPKLNPATLQRTGLASGMWARAFMDRHLRYWTEFVTTAKRMNDPLAFSKTMDQQAMARETTNRTLSGLLNEILLPVFSQAGVAVVRSQAEQETTEALLEAVEIQIKTGKLPTSIDQIPGTWIDPFDKKPLKLAMVGNSLRIYSVGNNLKDFGGQAPSEVKGRSTDDIFSDDQNIIAAYPPLSQTR